MLYKWCKHYTWATNETLISMGWCEIHPHIISHKILCASPPGIDAIDENRPITLVLQLNEVHLWIQLQWQESFFARPNVTHGVSSKWIFRFLFNAIHRVIVYVQKLQFTYLCRKYTHSHKIHTDTNVYFDMNAKPSSLLPPPQPKPWANAGSRSSLTQLMTCCLDRAMGMLYG